MINTVGALGGAVKGHLPRVWAFPKGLYPGATITSARLSPAWVLCYLIHVVAAVLIAAAIFSALKILCLKKLRILRCFLASGSTYAKYAFALLASLHPYDRVTV